MTLLEEIAQGEGVSLEFKESRPRDSLKFTKTVVAFANGRGGRILFGVEDGTGVVKGIDNAIVQKEMDAIADTIANCCTPDILPEITLANVEGKSVIVVNVRGGLKTPYYVRKLGIRKGTFQRVGATTREVEEYTLKSLILDGENQSFDRQVAKGAKMSKREVASVCRMMTETARQNCENSGRAVSVKAMTAVRLESLGLIVDENGAKNPTYALCLVAGKAAPGIMVPRIKCGVFRGLAKGDFEDHADFEGPVTEQIEQAFQFVKRNLHVRSRLTDENTGRKDIYEIPLDSVREAICNAVFHRNYLEPSNVYVALYADRLEILSPGGLLKEITIEEVRRGYSKIRNKGLAEALVYMHEVESWGGGVARYFSAMKNAGLPPPMAEEQNGFFKVVFWRSSAIFQDTASRTNAAKGTENAGEIKEESVEKSAEKSVEKSAEKIMRILSERPCATQKDLAAATGLSIRGVEKNLSKLKSAGVICRVGPDKGGHWEVTSRPPRV